MEKEIDLILIGLPRNMDGSYGPAAQKVEAFVAVLRNAITVPIKMWDERLTSVTGEPDFDPGQRPPRQAQGEGGQNGGGDFVAELSGRNLSHR